MSGRDKVLQSWYTIFDNTMVMQFTVSESSVLGPATSHGSYARSPYAPS